MARDASDAGREPFDHIVDRRSLLKGMAALGAGAGLAACGFRPGFGHGDGHGPPWGRVARPGDRPFPRVPEGTDMLPEIEHVVVLMMENHSYDSYFGALRRRGDGFRYAPDGKPRNANPDGTGNLVRAFHMPSTCQLHALPGQDWNRSHTSWDGGRNDGFVRGVDRGVDGLLGPDRPPLLLRAREHVPARGPLVRLGARADLPEPPVPHGRHRVGQREHVGRVAHWLPAAERDDLRPLPCARHLVAELLHGPAVGRDHLQDAAGLPAELLADQPVLRGCRRGHAAVLQPRRPELRHRVRGEPPGPPARRADGGEGRSTR